MEQDHMHKVHWDHYPLVASTPLAQEWLDIQAKIGLAPNTVEAYGRGLNDFLAFYQRYPTPFAAATKVQIAAYVADLRQRSHPKGANIRHLHSGTGLAKATIYQRVTVVRLFFDYLIETGKRENPRNPVGRGKYTPGKMFVPKKERGLGSPVETQPWLPSDEEWDHILDAASQEPIRNQLMLLLAYDGALRRSELVALEIRDLALPLQQITLRPEITKNGRGRVVMFGDVSRELLKRYLDERAEADIRGGHLFRSASHRNHSQHITPATWDKIVARLAEQADVAQFTTHTLRHLRLTDLARAGEDLYTIMQYAGHRNVETTKLYLRLSGRETAERVRISLQQLDQRLQRILKEAQQ
jgi:integrase/recombinase XerD